MGDQESSTINKPYTLARPPLTPPPPLGPPPIQDYTRMTSFEREEFELGICRLEQRDEEREDTEL